MKTIPEVEKDIEKTELNIRELEEPGTKPQKKLRKRLSFLRQMKMYLETCPTTDHLRAEKEKIEMHIENARMAFPDIHPTAYNYKKIKAEHDKVYELKLYREQLRTVNYLLK